MDILDYFFFDAPIPVALLTTPEVQAPVASTPTPKSTTSSTSK